MAELTGHMLLYCCIQDVKKEEEDWQEENADGTWCGWISDDEDEGKQACTALQLERSNPVCSAFGDANVGSETHIAKMLIGRKGSKSQTDNQHASGFVHAVQFSRPESLAETC
jgi:hypothetical protein